MFEIGKNYSVTNKRKKSYVEESFYEKDGIKIKREIGWRSGTWNVTITSQEEADKLTKFSSDDFDGDVVIYEEFDEVDFDSSWDGCWEDWEVVEGDVDIDEMMEEHEEKVDEDDDYEFYSFDEFLEEGAGYELVEDKSYFSGTPLSVEE